MLLLDFAVINSRAAVTINIIERLDAAMIFETWPYKL